jgi:hypothetical protein
MEQVEYPVMSGGNTIAVATVLLEAGMIRMQEPVTEFQLEAPAGLFGIRAECRNGKVTQVTFRNVPAFAAHLDAVIDVPTLGKVTVDVGWGGMFYIIADVRQFDGLTLLPERGRDITRTSALILRAAQDQLEVAHPDYPGIGITIAQLSGPTDNPHADRRNAVTMASGPHHLRRPLDLDRRDRPLPLRHRHQREDGRAARQRRADTPPALPPRRAPRHRLHRRTGRGDRDRRPRQRRSHNCRSGHGSPGSAATSLTRWTPSPTAPPSATCGPERDVTRPQPEPLTGSIYRSTLLRYISLMLTERLRTH